MLLIRRVGRRLRAQDGFTMMMALGVMTVTSLLTGAVFVAVQGDASLSRSDLDGKRAYAAAQAGVQAYLYQLNANSASSKWWQACANDSLGPTSVSGATDESYSYQPVAGAANCAKYGAVGTVVDTTTGLLRMKFTGTAGQYKQQRTLVVSFRPVTPLSYLWYTDHESIDPAAGPSDCTGDSYYWSKTPPASDCHIYWQTGDVVNGPMFSHDQLLIDAGATPYFGRAGSHDAIATDAAVKTVCAFRSSCPPGVIRGREKPKAQTVQLPSDNFNLLKDANDPTHGVLLPGGTTTLRITGTTAVATTCTSADLTKCTVTNIPNLNQQQLIYAPTVSGVTCPRYQPESGVDYSQFTDSGTTYFYGTCGDIYVSSPTTGQYTVPLTIAAADDVVVVGNLADATYSGGAPAGTATLGLVGGRNVRIYHPKGPGGDCRSAPDPDVTLDAAILTLSDSFFVDNYGCGSGNGFGHLHIHGAIAQRYRGAVGEGNGSGYLKDYNYDQRLALLMPPYMFDLQDASWEIVRETLCSPSSTGSTSCTSS